MNRKWLTHLVVVLTALAATQVHAGIASKAIREAVEFAGKKFGREVAEEGVERLTSKMVQLAAKHGDDVVSAAFKKVGPRAGRIASEAGEHGGVALRMLAKHGDDALPIVAKATSLKVVAQYGDDAAAAVMRHGVVGEELIGRFAREGVEALAKVTPQNGRRLAILAKDGVLNPETVSVVARYGDDACDFVWRNKGALAVGATLATFLAAPEEFLDGTRKLTTSVAEATIVPVAEAAIKPLAEVPKTVAAEAASHTNWTLVFLVAAAVVGWLILERRWSAGRVALLLKQWTQRPRG